MTKYDRIYIDAQNPSQWRPTHEDLFVEIQGPLICLTLEELREVFHEGHKSGIHRTVSQPVDNPHLNSLLDNYLTSKGIQP